MTAAGGYSPIGLDEYTRASAIDLGGRVARGELSPVQLAECALEIAKREEPRLNAYAAFMEGRALRTAALREAEVREGRVRSVLHGVPLASKDNLYIEGEAVGKGSLTSPDTPAPSSSPITERLTNAGVVIIGRTTTPEFGWKGTGISPRTGISRNPWDPTRNTGGSSAGSGATVASGAVPIATGSDAGGSVRIPAAFCGVVGMKPTRGAIPVWPGTVNEDLSHAGLLTRYVGDARAVFELTRGPDARDPQSFYSASGSADPIRRLRVPSSGIRSASHPTTTLPRCSTTRSGYSVKWVSPSSRMRGSRRPCRVMCSRPCGSPAGGSASANSFVITVTSWIRDWCASRVLPRGTRYPTFSMRFNVAAPSMHRCSAFSTSGIFC